MNFEKKLVILVHNNEKVDLKKSSRIKKKYS